MSVFPPPDGGACACTDLISTFLLSLNRIALPKPKRAPCCAADGFEERSGGRTRLWSLAGPDRGHACRRSLPGISCPSVVDSRHPRFRPPLPGRVPINRRGQPGGRRDGVPRPAGRGRAVGIHPGGVPYLP